MLCKTCFRMLHDHAGRDPEIYWASPYFEHHKNTGGLRRSVKECCSICLVLSAQLERNGVDLSGDRDLALRASLSASGQPGGYYPLYFKLDDQHIKEFHLKPIKQRSFRRGPRSFQQKTPTSDNTGSAETFELAKHWISRCKCASSRQEWYPDRLLDLQEVKTSIGLEKQAILKTKVLLVEASDEWKKEKSMEVRDNRYVTLSHCWGKEPVPVRLTSGTVQSFKTQGITLDKLPQTFRDAVIFASHLENVRFIWIDSLCIVQRSDDDKTRLYEEDWHRQSALMDKIYHQSYLNISAASSADSSGGLFFSRNPDLLRKENINLNITNLIDVRVYDEYSEGRLMDCMKTGLRSILNGIRKVSRQSQRIRCTVHDASLWEDLIEHAQVNTRGWVYQERLLSPRVLYFCGTQIAWECSEVDCCESYAEGVPSLRFKTGRTGGVAEEDTLKSLDSERSGKMLREARLRGLDDPDKELPGLYTYELWKRIVEVYSGKNLSHPGDKLIALSGIAKHFFDQKLAASLLSAEYDHPYVVGFWRNYLESQLLWHVPLIHEDGRYYNEAKRCTGRAPSFSWAALDAPQGIVYGEFTDQDVLFQVQDVNLRYKDARNTFGLVESADCRLLLNARLREIELKRIDDVVPYRWNFVDADKPENPLPEEPHINIFLDSPNSDWDIFEPGKKIFIMAGARGERTSKEHDRYLFCLLLRLQGDKEGRRVFKRIGLVKLNSSTEPQAQQHVKTAGLGEMYLI